MMKRLVKINILLAAAAAILAAACTKEPEMPYSKIEKRSLHAWMQKNRPDLLENYQQEGEYYVEVLEQGIADSASIHSVLQDDEQGECWVSFNVTGRNLEGDVFLTRQEQTARMEGTFTKYTHYVPYMRYIGAGRISILEGTYLAMANVLKIGGSELEVRCGTKLRLYLPSSVTGGNTGLTGEGGYEGSYSLDGNRPAIIEMQVVDRVNNPVAYEAALVDGFGDANGGISPVKEVEEGDEDSDDDDDDDDREEEDDGMAWRHACDTIPGLLVTKRYIPDAGQGFDMAFSYNRGTEEAPAIHRNSVYSDSGVYASLAELDSKINAAITERFGQGQTGGEKVGTEGTAKIWYIGRFLDGFIFDSNIDEVRELIYGTGETSRTAISYSPEKDKDNLITAWYYSVPEMRYGQWYAIATTSTFAYGATGQSGTTTTTTSGGTSYAYMPFYDYYNSYYGNSYYNNYYYNYYNYYNYYGGGYESTPTTTTTTISTEIQSYTPLLFILYIEPQDQN